MDLETNTTYYGQCRCCLVAGNHRDITQDYNFNGKKEIYCDMFLDCFNVFMPTNINTCNLICEDCVDRLRDADEFKKQVVNTEQRLMDALLRDEEPMMLVNVPVPEHTLDSTIGFEIKLNNVSEANSKRIETIPRKEIAIAPKLLNLDGAKGSRKNVKMPAIKIEPTLEIEGVVSDLNHYTSSHQGVWLEGGLMPKIEIGDSAAQVGNREETLEFEVTETELMEINEDMIENDMPPEDHENAISHSDRTKQKSVITEKMAHIINVSTILECSNITAFKSRTRSGFPCFYCRNIFSDFKVLREHQNREHLKRSIRTVLKKYSAESLVVYADVTDLKCTLCSTDLATLKDLKSHLVDAHNKKLYKKCTDRVIPFKLTESCYECQICNFYFETFGAIERHMNTHIRNYVCEQCGAGFITMLRLKTHIHSIHKEGQYPCNLCDKMFTTLQRYKGHVDFVHKMLKKLKCSKCPERFSDYFVQQKHLVEVHGEKPIVYKCNVCSRAFNRRYTLSCHMKRRHLEQRDVCCQFCMYTCYNNTELKEHMLKHNGVKMFTCNVCKKSYSRKKTLKEHMRLHYGQRFKCKICDQAFVHSNSLKLHVKVKHGE